MYSELSEVWR